MIRLHLMSYIDVFKFLNDPNRSWNEVATKPPEIYNEIRSHLSNLMLTPNQMHQ